MTFVPAHSVVQEPGANPTHTAFVLHGILGHQRNWRSFTRSLARAHPHWRFVLIDLRNHGLSTGAPAPHTVHQTAQDLVHLANEIGSPQAVMGHSFGGKVALCFAAVMDIEQTWVLDAIPSPQALSVRQELRAVFDKLRAAGAPFETREKMMTRLAEVGLPAGLVQWMTTNLRRGADGFDWVFELDAATEMVEDYFLLDAMPLLRSIKGEVHLVRAANRPRWTEAVLGELAQVGERVKVYVLPDSGHWVHVDNPTGLMELMRVGFGG
jgi:pimeloyl-ACP methyl ester carboxylesterase